MASDAERVIEAMVERSEKLGMEPLGTAVAADLLRVALEAAYQESEHGPFRPDQEAIMALQNAAYPEPQP